MHEMSIAEAIYETVLRVRPAGARVRAVTVRAGPMRGIEPEAMAWAWQALTDGSELADVKLELEKVPWRLKCPTCGKEFEAAELFTPCACGEEATCPIGGDDLQLMSMEVDEAEEGGSS